ncbi:cation diffusion facilitator family transporter [Cellulomonas sp. ACRRI]|uniref:cation diffusion facilitator family transporter n=1 Tax=Cellulomonas sp. ACRRI TaxID=2918188 RepID=UPI001EF31FD2|nr:cation diffusion facilitator family transporter [Cellulomonas sp. ACRRI]MCG7284761.1 cation diffusion facilitator family transporter [Cellulomonas sp. ACRRI]
MGAGHNHGPSPQQAGQVPDMRKKLMIAFALTFGVVIAQAIGSWVTGSLALLTDTAHALTDSTGLLVALIAATLMLKPASAKRTWGFRRIEVLAALAQATLLIVVGTYAAIEGVRRLLDPPEVASNELLIFGIIGLAANIAGLAILSSSRGANFNMRAAFLEVANDALGSLGVIIAAIVISTTGFQRADAIAGLFIALLIVPRAIKIVRETTAVLMEFTPQGLSLDEVRTHILALEHVRDVHDLHASTVGTGLPTLTAHVVVDAECFTDGHAPSILQDVRECVAHHFPVSIQHSTFQVETDGAHHDEPAGAVHP